MGHFITTGGLQLNPVTVKPIVSKPTLIDQQAVRRFLRAINYLAKFCPKLSELTQPLRDLIKEGIPFLW